MGVSSRTSQELDTVHLKSQRQSFPLFCRRQEGQAGSPQHCPRLVVQALRQNSKSLSHPAGTEPPSNQSWWKFLVLGRGKRWTITLWGGNCIFIKKSSHPFPSFFLAKRKQKQNNYVKYDCVIQNPNKRGRDNCAFANSPYSYPLSLGSELIPKQTHNILSSAHICKVGQALEIHINNPSFLLEK